MMLIRTPKNTFTLLLLLSALVSLHSSAALMPLISLENILQNEPTKAFYDTLSTDKQQEFSSIIESVNTICAQAFNQLNTLVLAHKELIEQYRQTVKVKALNFNVSLQPVIEN